MITRRNTPKHLFIGCCYSYNNFGHKAVHCKAYGQYNHRNIQRYKNNNYMTEKRNYNLFSPLQNFNIECKKCNNYGHKTRECRLPMQSLKTNPNRQNKKTWKRKSEVSNKKDDENIAPEIDEVNNRRLVGKTSNKEYNNQSYAYKVDQTQDMKTPKEKYDTIPKFDNVIQEDYPLPNKWKLIKEYSQNKDKEVSGAHNSDVDDEPSTVAQPEELSDDYLRKFSILF
jgi:hypothetical protein